MLHFSTYYHIFNHANGDDNLFREEKNYDFFLKKYHQHINQIADTVAWCLMKNHFHLLLRIKSEEEISSTFLKFKYRSTPDLQGFENLEGLDNKFIIQQFSNFFNSYSKAFNKVYQRLGSLFQKKFKRKEINNENYLLQAILYIHLNPVKHGFARQPDDWKHSSFVDFPETKPELTEWLFDSKQNYFRCHQGPNSNAESYQQMEDNLT